LEVEIMMTEKLPETIQRWTAQRREALVLSIITSETSLQEASRQHGLTMAELEEWKERFELGAENALRSRPRDEEAMRKQEVKKLQRKVGELVMDIDILKEAMKGHPFAPKMPDES
jgi:transposase-like protein